MLARQGWPLEEKALQQLRWVLQAMPLVNSPVFCDALGGVAVNADAVARAFASATF